MTRQRRVFAVTVVVLSALWLTVIVLIWRHAPATLQPAPAGPVSPHLVPAATDKPPATCKPFMDFCWISPKPATDEGVDR
jgi:hypothetical protein